MSLSSAKPIERNSSNRWLNTPRSMGLAPMGSGECAAEAGFIWRIGFLIGTVVSLLLAAVGAVLPLVPTTPFLLLALFCVSRVSRKWHQRLLASRWAGPVREWKRHRAIRLPVRRNAVISICVLGAVACVLTSGDLRGLIASLMGSVVGLVVVFCLPVIRET